ncbi:MAG: tetratricopeptide repeat protein [Chloroflexi bacterium]|nr:tetratricopeptide repeat protein [Chloroflexota bacterium]
MKVTRRRALFYKRRYTNLYRMFGLLVLLIVAVFIATGLDSGAVRNPFAPTPTSTRTANSLELEGQAFFDAGNLEAAITAYQEATNVDPDNASTWAALARIQAYSSRLLTSDQDRRDRLVEALASAEQAVALAPEDSQALAIYAFVLDWHGTHQFVEDTQAQLNRAEQQALRALSLNPNDALALAFYAEILIDQQKWNQAEQYIQQALQRGPELMDVHRVYAYYLESTLSYNQAIEEYQAALEINPNLTFLIISIGQNYRALAFRSTIPSQQTQLYEQALEYFAKASRLNEQLKILDPLPYVAIAKTYAQMGEFFAAARNAIKAVEIEPDNADLYGQLGNIYKRGRNYETSIIALKCAVRGCTPAESCEARGGCVEGDPGTTVIGLPLTSISATYYLDYGSVLAAFSPKYPQYCGDAVDVLTQLIEAYGDDLTIRINAEDGLAICASVAASQTQTPTFYPTSTPLPTPKP